VIRKDIVVPVTKHTQFNYLYLLALQIATLLIPKATTEEISIHLSSILPVQD
jgi:hypothetical protein